MSKRRAFLDEIRSFKDPKLQTVICSSYVYKSILRELGKNAMLIRVQSKNDRTTYMDAIQVGRLIIFQDVK